MEVDAHTSMTEQGHFRLGEAQFALHDYPSAEKAYAKALEVVSGILLSWRISGVPFGCNGGIVNGCNLFYFGCSHQRMQQSRNGSH